MFSQLSAACSSHAHGFDEKKIETHVGYCKHLLDAAKVHCEAAERDEQQNRQKLELARQVSLAEEARRKAEEQRKFQVCGRPRVFLRLCLELWMLGLILMILNENFLQFRLNAEDKRLISNKQYNKRNTSSV